MELNVYSSVGHGKYRGFGIVKDYEISVEEALLTTAANWSRFPPWGIERGLSGMPNYIVIIRNDKEILRTNRFMNFR